MSWNARRLAAALVVVPAVLGVAACGKTETPTASTTASSTAPASSVATTTTADTAAGPYKDKAAFVAALKKGTAADTTSHVVMRMEASGEKITMSGDTRIDANNPAMKVSMDMGSSMKLDMILVDKKIYMKGFPGLQAGKWAVLDSSSAAGKQMSAALDQADPSKMYDQFDKAVTDVKFVGKDTVDGESMDKYDLVLDTKDMKEGLSSAEVSKLPDTITYTAWVDAEDHLRRVTFDLMGAKADMRMSKYGEPVDIKAPAAADTVKMPM